MALLQDSETPHDSAPESHSAGSVEDPQSPEQQASKPDPIHIEHGDTLVIDTDEVAVEKPHALADLVRQVDRRANLDHVELTADGGSVTLELEPHRLVEVCETGLVEGQLTALDRQAAEGAESEPGTTAIRIIKDADEELPNDFSSSHAA